MSRTTLDLDPSVLGELRERSLREGKSMGALASELLSKVLKEGHDARSQRFEWISKSMGRPRVDLEDKEAVQAILDNEP